MTKKIFSIMAALALMTVAGTAAKAQDASVKAQVPFSFSVGETAFGAGNYTLDELSQSSWIVRNDRGKGTTAVAWPAGTNNDESAAKLVFKKYGEHYVLARVECLGRTVAIAEPKVERSIEIQMGTHANLKPETVYVLASAR